MNVKKESGLAGVDMAIAILAVMIFSTLIISMIHANLVENVKLKKETLAMIYLTELFEKVGIESYDNIQQSVIRNWITDEVYDIYTVNITVNKIAGNKDIIKKVKVTLYYEVNGENYSCSMERMKIKE